VQATLRVHVRCGSYPAEPPMLALTHAKGLGDVREQALKVYACVCVCVCVRACVRVCVCVCACVQSCM